MRPPKRKNKRSTPIPNPLPAGLGWDNQYGYVAIFTLGLALFTAVLFSEAMWQRVWASTDRRTLHAASGFACTLVIIVVFLSGFFGWLALVGGLADPKTTSPNLYLFQVCVFVCAVCVEGCALSPSRWKPCGLPPKLTRNKTTTTK